MISVDSLNIKIWSKLGARGTFGLALLELGKIAQDLMVLTADLANTSGLDRYQNIYPEKFLNIGIAEQNLIGIASGMAKEGKNVFVTSFATFAAMRSYEQIRFELGYMGSNVKVVGLASGVAMGMFGVSHYGFEDLSIMRAIPGLTVLSPADGTEIVKTVSAMMEFKGPAYIRLTGTMNNPIVYKEDYCFEIGKAVVLKTGRDVAIIATGTMVHESLIAAEILEKLSISVMVINMHTIKPLDRETVVNVCRASKLIVTVEEHSIIGGLGGAVAECKAKLKNSPPQLRIGLPDKFGQAGEYRYLLEKYGLVAKKIAETIVGHYENTKLC